LWDRFRNLHEFFHERIEEMQRLGGLRIWILHVLDEGPKNGVEIMDSIEEHHNNIKMRQMSRNDAIDRRILHTMKHQTHRPSPGSIYPMLKKMVDENLITKQDNGKYELTDKGREIAKKVFGHYQPQEKQMDRSAYAVEHSMTELDSYVSYLEDINKDKLISYKEMIDELSIRLKNLKESIEED
jgi:DNA-binding PadR family transcriptional regulator